MPKSIAIAIAEYFFEKFNCQLSMLFYLRAFPLTINLSWSTAAAALGCWTAAIYHGQCQSLHSQNYITQGNQ